MQHRDRLTRFGVEHLRVVVASAALSVLASCTTVVAGSPVKAPGDLASGVDTAALDTGNYPTKPAAPLGKAGSEFRGRLLEGQRMANNVVGPWEVNPALAGWIPLATSVIKDTKAIAIAMDPQLATTAEPHNFIVGFSSERKSLGSRAHQQLLNAVLRFANPESASAAAADFSAKLLTRADSGHKRPIAIPGHSDATAATYDVTEPGMNQASAVAVSFTAHAAYVLYERAISIEGADPAARLVAGVLDRQKPLIDQFYAADPATFADLPRDPSGLLAHTLPMGENDPNVNAMSVYEPRAALHFEPDPIGGAALFDQSGMQQEAVGKTSVYQAIDTVGAAHLVDGFATDLSKQEQPYKAVEGVPHMPTAKCLQSAAPSMFSCFAVADRYAIRADSAQLPDAHQQIAAQYRMLMGT